MTRNLNFLKNHLGIILVHFLIIPFAIAAEKERAMPNILLVLTDDQGYSDVGFNGNPILKTPILDQLAAESTVFDRFYASPVCSPSRASLMTGKYSIRTGVVDTQNGQSILSPDEITLAEVLQAEGYRTGMFGKWHLGDNAPARPIDQGFEEYLTHVGGMIGAPYSPLSAQSYFDPVLIENGVEKSFEGYCMDIFTQAAEVFISGSSDQPFFLFYAPNTPHHPLTVPEKYAKPYLDQGLSVDTSNFYGMIANIDENMGKLLNVLKESGQLDNTLIVFLGDNGTSSLHQQDDLWESGLRGRKTYVYENGIRVPMMIKLPNQKDGDRLEIPGTIEDIFPTILELCQIKMPRPIDGLSLIPALNGETALFKERTLFFQFHRMMDPPERFRNIGVIQGEYKLVQPTGRGALPFSPESMNFELYHLSKDPFEKNDISKEHPQIVKSLKAAYLDWIETVYQGEFEMVPTWIGSESQEQVVTLSRQDWRGGGLFDGDLGYYKIDVRQSGWYRITCQWSELLKETHSVVLNIGDQVLKKEILYAESACRFDRIYLEKGIQRLEAWVKIKGQRNGFRFIEIEKLDAVNEHLE